jgi:two-component system sensor histidine kinase AlgZ
VYREGKELHLEVRNPRLDNAAPRLAGNKMAISNIRERLDLLFDVEAQYQVDNDATHYRVYILIPYVKG